MRQCQTIWWMFGFAVTIIDFEWNDHVKLILIKNEMNVNWFVFEYIHVKVNWIINFVKKQL